MQKQFSRNHIFKYFSSVSFCDILLMLTSSPSISVAYMLSVIVTFRSVLTLFCVYKPETRLNEQALYGSCDVILARREKTKDKNM